jgi:hypothetical protein
MTTAPQPARYPSLIGPLVLIGLGVLFLLGNLGWLNGGLFDALLRLWPLLLIAVGLELVVGRRSAGAAWIIALLTLLAFGAGTWLIAIRTPIAVAGHETIEHPIGNAERAAIHINSGVGTLQLGPLRDSANLVEADLDRWRGETIRQDFRVVGDEATWTLSSESQRPWGMLGRQRETHAWRINLNPAVPTDLTLNTGVGTTQLDLLSLNLTRLDTNTGAGTSAITLPQQGQLSATINTGVGQTTITIPQGMAASIDVEGGLGGHQVVGDFEQEGERYVSPGFNSAVDRIELQVRGGVGNLLIREAAAQ